MPRLTKGRTFAATDDQRALARRELQVFLEALCHDQQFAVRHCCWLIEVLKLPARITRDAQIDELATELALYREKLASNPRRRWIGRPWTKAQLRRVFYASPTFRRPVPHPVTRDELETWTPNIPPIELERRRAK